MVALQSHDLLLLPFECLTPSFLFSSYIMPIRLDEPRAQRIRSPIQTVTYLQLLSCERCFGYLLQLERPGKNIYYWVSI